MALDVWTPIGAHLPLSTLPPPAKYTKASVSSESARAADAHARRAMLTQKAEVEAALPCPRWNPSTVPPSLPPPPLQEQIAAPVPLAEPAFTNDKEWLTTGPADWSDPRLQRDKAHLAGADEPGISSTWGGTGGGTAGHQQSLSERFLPGMHQPACIHRASWRSGGLEAAWKPVSATAPSSDGAPTCV